MILIIIITFHIIILNHKQTYINYYYIKNYITTSRLISQQIFFSEMGKGQYLLLFFISFIHFTIQKQDDGTTAIGQRIQGISKKQEGGQSIFQLKIQELVSQSYLFFSASLGEIYSWQTISMTIYKKNGRAVLAKCKGIGMASCFVNTTKFVAKEIILARVQCVDDCIYLFESRWSKVKQILINESVAINFPGRGIGYLFEYVNKQEKGSQIQFVLESNNKISILERGIMYASNGEKVPSIQQHQMQSMLLWQKAHGIFIKSEKINDKVTILVEGNPLVPYTLTCKSIKDNSHILLFGVPLHDYISKEETHQIEIPITVNQKDEMFSIDITMYMGTTTIGFFQDSARTIPFQVQQMAFQGSSRYTFSGGSIQQHNLTKLYMTIQSLFPTTYSLKLGKSYINQAIELKQQIYNFISVNDKQLIYMKVRDWGFSSETPKDIVINVLNMDKNMKQPIFRLCKKSLYDCTLLTKYQSATKVIEPKISDNNESLFKIYRIPFDKESYKELIEQSDNSIMIMQLSAKTNTSAFMIIYCIDENHISGLDEKLPRQSSIQLGAKKYYYYKVPEEYKKSKVTIHFEVVGGEIQIQSSKNDPRQESPKTTKQKLPSIEVDNINGEIYLIVTGLTESSYLISVRVTDQTIQDTSRPLIEGIQSRIIINPGESTNLMIQPKSIGVIIHYQSTGEITGCMTNQPTSPCEENNLDVQGNKGVANFPIIAQKTYFKVINNNHKKAIDLTIIYHSGQKSPCIQKTLGKIYSDIIEDNYCARYVFKEFNQDLQGVFLRTEFYKLQLSVMVCNSIVEDLKGRFTLPLKLLNQKCVDTADKTVEVFFYNTQQNESKNMKVQYVLLEAQQPLELPDGIGHMEYKRNPQKGPISIYQYILINKIDTQVLIHNKIGSVMGYIKILEVTQDSKNVTNTNYDLVTDQSYIYLSGPQAIINEDFITKATCNLCKIAIAVYATDNIIAGEQIAYTIEATQNTKLLNENQLHSSFLYKDQVAYFRYECPQKGNSLIFDLTDHHSSCARVYVNNRQYPSASNNIGVMNGNEIAIQCQSYHYFFAVEAIKDCPISIVAQSTGLKMTKIRGGYPVQFSIQQNEVHYFMYLHSEDKHFKIISLEKYGNVDIYATQATSQIVNKIKSGDHNFAQFSFKATGDNILTVSRNNSRYCIKCIYLIAVISKSKIVDSTLFIIDKKGIPILMVDDKLIEDSLDPHQNITFQYFNVLKGKIFLTIYKGTAQLIILYQNKNFTWTINSTNSDPLTYDFTNTDINYDWDPIYVYVNNNGESVTDYSLHLVSDSNPLSKSYLLKSSVTAILNLKGSDEFCFRGVFLGQKQKIHLSVDKKDQSLISSFIPTLTVNDKNTSIKQTIIQNILQIQIDSEEPIATDNPTHFILCLQSHINETLKIKVLQSGKIRPLSSLNSAIIINDQILMVRPYKVALFDIFTCKDEVRYAITTNYEDLEKADKTLTVLDSTKNTKYENQKNHIVYYEADSQQIFIEINSIASFVNWFDFDLEKETGIGYKKYSIGTLQQNIKSDVVELFWGGVKSQQKTSTSIKHIKYRVIIANSPSQTKSAANCQIFSNVQFYFTQIIFEGSDHQKLTQTNIVLSTQIKKKDIRDNFTQKYQNQIERSLYITISAEVDIIIPNTQSQIQSYRFIYNQIQLPRTLILNDGEVSHKYNFLLVLVVSIGLAIIGLFLIAYIIIKKLVPLISRIRNSSMVQEEVRNGDSAPSVEIQASSQKKMVVDEQI